ncbi:hydrogenase maturation nickel metallochaperone HypA [Methanomassiliicoccus luminyensis]|uniref:hydrogenase maturation nickel metallochaperone HypA n=2 Tax=Methanomassiliicoccus luminyensis TaxID=1080712 RepID=UPI0003650F9C|nr:hydrogenase maturation nickel metallochaperone HypA [Methanomassiliicoccus luminyensis]
MENGMHEVSVMSSIIESVLEELKKYNVEKVEEVHLTIGEMTFLGEDQLSFAFEILSKGTLLEGSQLIIGHEDAEVKCRSCQYQGAPDRLDDEIYHSSMPTLNCPKCGRGVELTKGKSCLVRSVKVVEADVPVQG